MTSPSHFIIMTQNADPAFYWTPTPAPTIWNLRVNIIKILKRDYKQNLVKDIKVILRKKNQKKAEYGHERHKNLSEHEKQKLVEYRNKCYEMKKYIWLLINLATAWDGCYYLTNYNC